MLEPAIVQHFPVLAKVKAPRIARPLRAAALTSAPRRDELALVAGWSNVQGRRRAGSRSNSRKVVTLFVTPSAAIRGV